MLNMESTRHRRGVIVALLTVATFAYCSFFAFQGILPLDDGMLAQMATRVLQGEIPHRDFDEIYSGGLTWLNALSFLLWGTSFASLRLTMLIFEVATVPVLFSLLSRFTTPLAAALLCAVCVTWGPPNNFCGLPSWYNSFFALFGTWFLVRYAETDRQGFSFCAGVMAGFSFLAKLCGLYFLLAGAIFLASRRHRRVLVSPGEGIPIYWVPVLVTVGVTAILVSLLQHNSEVENFLYFLGPAASLGACWITWAMRDGTRMPVVSQLKEQWVRQWALWVGFFVPVVPFLLFFAEKGALRATLWSIFVLPQRRYEFGHYALPSWHTWIWAIPCSALFGASLRGGSRAPSYVTILIGMLALAVLSISWHHSIYVAVWSSVRALVPMIVIGGSYCLSCIGLNARGDPLRREILFLFLLVLTFTSLVQYPYSSGAYFCYIAMFLILVAAGLIATFSVWLRGPLLVIAAFYGCFAACWLNEGWVQGLGVSFVPSMNTALLVPGRADIYVPPGLQRIYEEVVKSVQLHSAGTDFIFAGPDCPEVYFLANKKNPTRILYDFINPVSVATESILEAIDKKGVKTVVLNIRPSFSHPYEASFLRELESRFPHSEQISNFLVIW